MDISIIIIDIVSLSISAGVVINRFVRIKNSDKITFVKDDKSITISTNPSKDDRIKLYNF
jgi:hypothetical protein